MEEAYIMVTRTHYTGVGGGNGDPRTSSGIESYKAPIGEFPPIAKVADRPATRTSDHFSDRRIPPDHFWCSGMFSDFYYVCFRQETWSGPDANIGLQKRFFMLKDQNYLIFCSKQKLAKPYAECFLTVSMTGLSLRLLMEWFTCHCLSMLAPYTALFSLLLSFLAR